MVRLFCSALQVKEETHESLISVFANQDSTSFMINIKNLQLDASNLDDCELQLLAEEVARAIERTQQRICGETTQPHLKAV
jgi:hypothetical protein